MSTKMKGIIFRQPLLWTILLCLSILFTRCGETEKGQDRPDSPAKKVQSTSPEKGDSLEKKEGPVFSPFPALSPEDQEKAAALATSIEQEDLLEGWDVVIQLLAMGPGILPFAENLLASEEEGARIKAIFILEAMGDERFCAPLIKLMKDPSPTVKALSAEVFGKLMKSGDAFLTGELISSLKDPSGAVSAATALALYRSGSFLGIPMLVEGLRGGVWKGEESIRALKEIYGEDMGYLATASNRERLELYEQWMKKYQADRRTVDGLIAELGRYKFVFTMRAREALLALGQNARDALVDALHSENVFVRYNAVELLEKVGDPTSLEGIRQLLTDEDYRVRAAAAGALSHLGGKDAVHHLFPLLNDPAPGVRMEGTRLIGESGEPAALPHLIRAYASESNNALRQPLAKAIGSIGESAGIGEKISLLKDRDVRSANELQALTGLDWEMDVKRWEEWWKKILEEGGF